MGIAVSVNAGLAPARRHRLSATADQALLARLQSGDRRAFEALMRRHGGWMLGLAQRLTGSRADADEIVQEVFLKVWTRTVLWQRDGPPNFPAWAYRVVLNASIDRRRRPGAASMDSVDDVADLGPDGILCSIQRQRGGLLRAALRELPARQRDALLLSYFDEMTGQQTADALGASAAGVESLLRRGKKALKAALRRRGVAHLEDLL